jgi:hypothetical protein
MGFACLPIQSPEVQVARVLWQVVPQDETWKVFREGVRVLAKPDRQACLAYAERQARTEWEVFELPARLMVGAADGTTEDQIDFGEDTDPSGP